VPRAPSVEAIPDTAPVAPAATALEAESFVLCIDNETRVLEAMATLLGGWGCKVATATGEAEALERIAAVGRLPDLVLADLHLDDRGEGKPDGLAVIESLRRRWGRTVPAALVTADREPLLRLRARAQQVELLHKPVKPAALRALLRMRERSTAVV
jgi:CheY-like chemotaxis protein